MNNPTIDHVLITRFNVPTAGRESLIRAREGWLRQRVELFDSFCLPSVVQQSNTDFHWMIYFDPESPQWFMEWLRQHESRGSFRPVFRTAISNDELVADMRSIAGARAEVLVTTNLDNDDALATDFVERIQDAVHGTTRTAIYLQNGAILRSPRVYLRRDRENAFCSVAESWHNPVTAWADWHNRLRLSMPVVVIGGPPAWLQVVHGSNVSNAVHGSLTTPRSLSSRFPHVLTSLPNPTIADLAFDVTLWRPLRGAKSFCRRTVKSIGLGLLGRDGFDGLKNRVAERLNRRLAGSSPAVSPSTTDQHTGAEK